MQLLRAAVWLESSKNYQQFTASAISNLRKIEFIVTVTSADHEARIMTLMYCPVNGVSCSYCFSLRIQPPHVRFPREASAIQADDFYTYDVNLPRIQASLPNGYSTPLLV